MIRIIPEKSNILQYNNIGDILNIEHKSFINKENMNKSQNYSPIDGARTYNALRDENMIIMAANVQIIPGVLEGIMQATKDTDSAVIFESATSECDLNGGYTGMTPKDYARFCFKTASKVKLDTWVLHADHIKIKSLSEDEISGTEDLIKAQIDAGFTSFAIDASFLFDLKAKTEKDQLRDNIDITARLAKFIKKHYINDQFGLEVEVGEIGKKDTKGMVLTTPKEAVTFLQELDKNNIKPNLIAIANGSAHGNIYKDGKEIFQSAINIKLTREVARAIRKAGFETKIAQHGITGTPLDLIAKQFPKGDILKGNVATFWRNLVWGVFKKHEPKLYKKIYNWTIKNYQNDKKSKEEIFGKNGKYAIREFYDEINAVESSTVEELKQKSYAEAKKFFKAFNSKGSAKIIRDKS